MVKQVELKGAQSAKFIDAARDLECDGSEERFNAALGEIAKHRPMSDKSVDKKTDGGQK